MMLRLSLYNRFRLLFLTAVTATVLVSSVLAFHIWGRGILDATGMHMMVLANEYKMALSKNPHTTPPSGQHIKLYRGWDSVPQEIQHRFPLDQHSDLELMHHGFQMFEETTPETELRFLLPYPLIDGGEKLYVYSQFKPDPHVLAKDHEVVAWIETVALFNFCLILFLGFRIERYLLKPIKALEQMAKRLKDKVNIDAIPSVIRDDEIGAIATPLKQAVEQIQQYHQRETQFLETASHELRTSISVVRSALDIIAQRQSRGRTDFDSPLRQIRTANKNMAALTETLLHLSKAPERSSPQQMLDLEDLLRQLIEEHRYLLCEETHQVNFTNKGGATVTLEPTLCRIVLANLLRNAFEHAGTGAIDITLEHGSVRVHNQAPRTSNLQQKLPSTGGNYGYGLGLEIVQRVAKREGWALHIDSASADVFKVRIDFT